MSKEEKKAQKEKNEAITLEYGFCMLDGHKEKIGNFRAEPPGLFRGRGEHPKQVGSIGVLSVESPVGFDCRRRSCLSSAGKK